MSNPNFPVSSNKISRNPNFPASNSNIINPVRNPNFPVSNSNIAKPVPRNPNFPVSNSNIVKPVPRNPNFPVYRSEVDKPTSNIIRNASKKSTVLMPKNHNILGNNPNKVKPSFQKKFSELTKKELMQLNLNNIPVVLKKFHTIDVIDYYDNNLDDESEVRNIKQFNDIKFKYIKSENFRVLYNYGVNLERLYLADNNYIYNHDNNNDDLYPYIKGNIIQCWK
jgi:hypothetical protein